MKSGETDNGAVLVTSANGDAGSVNDAITMKVDDGHLGTG